MDLVIEIDGDSHQCEEQQLKDHKKTQALAAYDLTILRFFESEVRKDMDNVLRSIQFYIEEFEEINRV